jgi:DNA-binding CsgD family transcriptional regulator
MWPIDRPPKWVDRSQELATLRAGIEALRHGGGTAVWVEGEPGIGKSSLVAEALAGAGEPGWDIGWGIADQLAERLPLSVMQDCLQVRLSSPDPRRARAAGLLRSQRLGLFADGDVSVSGVEVLMALTDELCAAAPTVMVVDDLQWADDASLLVWHQLAASIDQLRLLLVATSRSDPRRAEVRQVRTAMARRGGAVVSLGPLPETDAAALVTAMLGTSADDALRQLTAQAAGNPLYLRELADAVARDRTPQVSPAAGVWPARDQLPASLAAVLNDRLSAVSAQAAQILRTAALLGGKFTVTDLAVLLRRPVSELAAGLQEAVAARILVGSGSELAFRHQLIQQALYESMPTALRTALHAEAARELAATGADALSVAQQLTAGRQPGEGWARAWLLQNGPALTTRAPQLTADLLRQEVDETPRGDEAWGGLTASLVRALLATGSYDEAARQARAALPVMTDPVPRAETYSVLARAQVSAGRSDEAITTMRQALASTDLPRQWRARMLAFLAMLERADTGDLDTADKTARQALAVAEDAGDAFATAHALTDLWLSHSIRRDHAAALDDIDQALRVLGDDPGYADLRSFALDDRIFTLQNLDRWEEAERTLQRARESAQRSGSPDRTTWVTAAVLRYWLGQWDDALAELSTDEGDAPGLTYTFLRERWPALLVHGVTALIAGRRDQRTTADQHLRAGLALPILRIPDRENRDFLLVAHAVALEQRGEAHQAMQVLAAIVPRRDGEMTLTHQWLPDLVRLALATGDRQIARTATQACQEEAAAETRPARAATASLRCQGLLKSDPAPLRDAVAHYRTVGPATELPAAVEDLAAVLAEHGQEEEARAALNEAVSLYEALNARWDIRRADSRLRPYGIRRGVRGPRGQRAASGWESLTPTEVKIAALVARGDSTSEIARGMFLSRRTVQTYISHILAKLGAKSRVEIVREALRHGISPLAGAPGTAPGSCQRASARFLRASFSPPKLASARERILPEKATSRPRKVSLCTSRVPPSAGVSMKLCSPLMMPGRLDSHLSSTPGSATVILGLTVIRRPLAGWTLRSVILFPTATCPDAWRNSGFHSG